jgi:predicted MFS family arabinose efflux permease
VKLDSYRSVLSLPGVRSLMVLALLGRIPLTAVGVTLTLHVVGDLHLGYAQAGLVGTAGTIGSAIGAPLMGRVVDRRGLRPVILLTTIVELVFWLASPALPYAALLVTSIFAGTLSLPIFSIVRQSLAAMVPAEQRRRAYAVDSMSTELSYMAGPTLSVLLVTYASAATAMRAIGLCLFAAGIALWITNPPVRGVDDEVSSGPPPRRRQWVTPQLLAVFAATVATTTVLAGSDVSVVAVLRQSGAQGWIGGVLALWGLYSLTGGFIYGARSKAIPLVLLVGLLSVFTFPIGFVGHHWGWIALTLLPAGALCAPTLTATSDSVSKLVPSSARGEAMGWHGSALTLGMAIGAPLAGAAMDAGAPSWGFASVAVASGIVTVFLLLVRRRLTASAAGEAGAGEVGVGVDEAGVGLADAGKARVGVADGGEAQVGGAAGLGPVGAEEAVAAAQFGEALAEGDFKISERQSTKV